MEKGKRALIKLLIVLISVVFIDGGRSFLLVSSNLQNILNHNPANDIEIPHQHHIVNFSTDEKFLESFKIEFSCFKNSSIKINLSQDIASQEFSDSIWQPPKFV
jgi:hypothetical protein